jgi:hypothetical protein
VYGAHLLQYTCLRPQCSALCSRPGASARPGSCMGLTTTCGTRGRVSDHDWWSHGQCRLGRNSPSPAGLSDGSCHEQTVSHQHLVGRANVSVARAPPSWVKALGMCTPVRGAPVHHVCSACLFSMFVQLEVHVDGQADMHCGHDTDSAVAKARPEPQACTHLCEELCFHAVEVDSTLAASHACHSYAYAAHRVVTRTLLWPPTPLGQGFKHPPV